MKFNKPSMVTNLLIVLLMCISEHAIEAVTIKERTGVKSSLKQEQSAQKYIGDPMLMQASEPEITHHFKDASL